MDYPETRTFAVKIRKVSILLGLFALTVFAFGALEFRTVAAQTVPQRDGGSEVFKRVRTSIVESERKNVVDERIYRSSIGLLVEYYAELCDTSERAKSALEAETSKWNCGGYEDVLDVKGRKVGKRTICNLGKTSGQSAIVFTYNDILTIISGSSVETLKKFESETCVRSKTIPGVPCKY